MKNILATLLFASFYSIQLSAQLTPVATGIKPYSMAIGEHDIYLSELENDRIIKVNDFQSNPIVSTYISGLSNPFQLALDGNFLYYSASERISKIDITQSNPVSIDLLKNIRGIVNGMAIRGNELYFHLNRDGVYKIDITQSNPIITEVLIGAAEVADLIFIDEELYMSSVLENKIFKIDVTQSNPVPVDVLTGIDWPRTITAKGNELYASQRDNIVKIDLTQPNPVPVELLSGFTEPFSLSFVGNDLYICDLIDGIFKFPASTSVNSSLPFEEDFEDGVFPSNLVPFANKSGVDGIVEIESGIGLNSSKGLRMGKLNDNTGFTTNALDLYLDLTGETNVEMSFWITDSYDDTNDEDGIYFSDNGGDTFVKVVDFHPSEWCDNFWGEHPPLDIDKLAKDAGLNLNAQFIIRFQQRGDRDFAGSNSNAAQDGFRIDEIRVFDPNLVYATLPFEDDFENGLFTGSWARSFADETSKVFSNNEPSSPMNIIEVQQGIGLNSSYGVRMGRRCDGAFSVNALDLNLNLLNQSNVEMSFWITDSYDNTDNDDGIYFSDDGGDNFTKVLDFFPSEWCDNFWGEHPPLDVDELAQAAGLNLTSRFVIRFQQRGENDFTGSNSPSAQDGLRLDNVKVYDPNLTYATLPFEDDFENGLFKESWARNFADNTSIVASNFQPTSTMNIIEVQPNIGLNSSYGVRVGRRCDGAFSVNALDLNLNLNNQPSAELTFWLADSYDNTDNDDGIYFSDNGGDTFTKVFNFDFSNTPDNVFQEYKLNITDLASSNFIEVTDKFVIRFQQRGENDFAGSNAPSAQDGFRLDNVNVYTMISSTQESLKEREISIYPIPSSDIINMRISNIEDPQIIKVGLFDMIGIENLLRAEKISNNEYTIDISTLPVGIYNLTLWFADAQMFTKKIIKN